MHFLRGVFIGNKKSTIQYMPRKEYSFCYGPLNCKLYKAGPNRKVEGRNGMVFVEEDWMDEQRVEHWPLNPHFN